VEVRVKVERKFLGTHIIAELYGCDPVLLDDVEFITSTLIKSAEKTKVTVVDYATRKFEPQGVSAIIIISESHIAIHTWPELKYAALDFYTCGEEDPEPAVREIARKFKTKELVLFRADRGNISKIEKIMRSNIKNRENEEIRTDEMQVLL
jgi:S-adenosylmethionine decarboxylase